MKNISGPLIWFNARIINTIATILIIENACSHENMTICEIWLAYVLKDLIL